MTASTRIARVNEILKREIADLLERKSFKDGSCLISITEVKTSPDLRHATVYVSIFGGDDKTKRSAVQFLLKNRYDLQKKIARDIVMKYTPVLEFIVDKKIADGDRVLSIIRELEKDEK